MPELLTVCPKTVLIASSSHDQPTWSPVVEKLSAKGLDVLIYEADKVATGELPFSAVITPTGLKVEYDNRRIDLQEIGSAWFRRLALITDSTDNAVRQLGLDTERRLLMSSLWQEIPDERWLNSPGRMERAGRKLAQLRLAAQLGFNIPDTVLTNDWQTIHDSLPHDVIYKASQAMLFDGEDFLSLFTTPFSNRPESMPLQQNPFPGIWQPQLHKSREWRVTVVDDQVFSAAIYSSDDAKDDWRKHQSETSKISFKAEQVSDEIQKHCIEYLSAVGLRYGAFDFIEDHDGHVTFLECNPNGQFMWLEHALEMPISAAIADSLAKTAGS